MEVEAPDLNPVPVVDFVSEEPAPVQESMNVVSQPEVPSASQPGDME